MKEIQLNILEILKKNDQLVEKFFFFSLFQMINFYLIILVTVYLNYVGDNSGMLLNPHKFRSSMPSIFGPNDCQIVLTSIFNSCIKCAFQQEFPRRILNTFSISKDEKQDSYTQIKCKDKKSSCFFF